MILNIDIKLNVGISTFAKISLPSGNVAEWLRRGLQILVSRFDSGRCLQKNLVLVIKKSKFCFLYSSVAQLVEQLTVNQLVAGSSPARGAIFLIKKFTTL